MDSNAGDQQQKIVHMVIEDRGYMWFSLPPLPITHSLLICFEAFGTTLSVIYPMIGYTLYEMDNL